MFIRKESKKKCNEAKYVVVMISESYAWAGYGDTEEEAKEMIQKKYSEIMGEISMEELEKSMDSGSWNADRMTAL